MRHQMQMQIKQQSMMMQQQAMLQPQGRGGPGGGQPRPGAAPAGMRNQGPPGSLHQDRIPLGMPRAVRG
jgi:hypothetical protein